MSTPETIQFGKYELLDRIAAGGMAVWGLFLALMLY